jgi:hypothetical protein
VQLETMFQRGVLDTPEGAEVQRVALALKDALCEEPACTLLREANSPTKASHLVQDALLPAATALGFRSEVKGLFHESISGLRPDYYKAIGDSGILLEVERGKTTTNNMDLLDFWKVHICTRANYLFLFVPIELRHNPNMSPKKEFAAVRRRLAPFFEARNVTNVRGLCLFGY